MIPYSTHEYDQLLREKYGGSISPEFEADLERLKAGEPLAYIIGTIPFLRTTIHLDSRPLIPRIESEFWLENALVRTAETRGHTPLRVLDIFAGSGALGIAWAKQRPNDHVTFAEIDEKHLRTIQKNIAVNKIKQEATLLVQSDIWENSIGTFDIILANPPYIPEGRTLESSVRDWEPGTALFGGGDGLFFIRAFIAGIGEHIAEAGVVYLEHDTGQEDTIAKLFPTTVQTKVLTDQYGMPRVTVAYYE